MSYCVKHAENFHTQTCCRCNDESAIAAKDAEIAALRQEIATGRGQYHRDYAAECDALLAAKDKVIADLSDEIAALRQQSDDLRDVLSRNGFTRCDIAACNCGSWHHTHGLRARWEEIKDALDDSGHPLTNENGNLVIRALGELVAERDALRERCGRLAEEVKCRRERRTVHTCGPDMTGDCKACVRLGRIADAELAVDTHNDLAPAAKEQTDGR